MKIWEFINAMSDTYCCRFSVYDIETNEYLVDNEYEDEIYEGGYEDLLIEGLDIYTTKGDEMARVCFNVDSSEM